MYPGDEVILFEPYYGYHYNTVVALGLTPVLVPLRPPTWALDPDLLLRALSPRTRAVVLCTPGNPSGKVWGEAELDALGDFARAHDLTVITDEIYEHIGYDGRRHVPLASRAVAHPRRRASAST